MQTPPADCPIPGARGWILPEGTGALRVLILGEAGGEQEAYAGTPFCSWAPAGSLLERAIARSGYSRAQFVLHNVVPTQPPKNWLEGAPYEAAAVEWGRPMLERVIRDYNVGAILALGNIPLRATTGMCGELRSISHLQNWVLPSRWPGVAVVPALHPAFIRRGALALFSVLMHGLKLAVAVASAHVGEAVQFFSPVLWRDFEWVGRESLGNPTDPIVPAGYVCYPDEARAFEFLRECEHNPSALVAYDIETPRSTEATENDSDELQDTEILSIQFSIARGTGIFLPWRDGYREAAKAVLALPNPKAGANTWRFDDPLLEAHGCTLGGARHDVRWAWKALQPDLRAPLQLIASFYCVGQPRWGPWKHAHASHPEWYGIRDVDVIQYILN
jgi:uracil-DNA glycosylase family 4